MVVFGMIIAIVILAGGFVGGAFIQKKFGFPLK